MRLNKIQSISLAISAIIIGVLIFFVSLVVSSQFVANGEQTIGIRRLYFSSDIKPDHVFYPVLMIFDRLKLKTASDQDKILIEIVYAEKRYDHVIILLEQGDVDLAASTLGKSQKYLLSAAQKTKEHVTAKEQKNKLTDLILSQTQRTQGLIDSFSDNQAMSLDRLVEETRVVAKSINE